MAFDQMLEVLWRAKFTLLAAALAVALLGFVGARIGSPLFGSEGQLLIESRDLVIPELGQNAAATPMGLQRIRTEADILRSRRLAEDVARTLDLTERGLGQETSGWRDQLLAWPRIWRAALLERLGLPMTETTVDDPLEKAVTEIRKRLDVRTSDNSNVVTLRFLSKDPTLSASVINIIMERYISLDIAARQATTAQANVWLSERLISLRSEFEAADRRVQVLLRRSGLTQTSFGSTDAQQVREEQDRLAAARQEVSRAQSALASALRPERAGLVQVLTSPTIQALIDREAEIVQRAEGLSQRLGERHPDRMAVDGELRGVRRQIDIETNKAIAGLRRDLDAAQARLEDSERALEAARTAASTSRESEVQLAQLRSEADARRGIYQAFLMRVEQTQLASAQFASARIISPAVPSTRPTGPSMAVIVLVSGFAGLVLAALGVIARRATDGSIDSVSELVALTGRPCAASLPALRRSARRGMAAQVLEDPQSDVAETLRALRIALQAVAPDGKGCCALIASAEVGDGKSTLAAALARLSAADGMRVLLVEGDMRRPRLASMLEVSIDGPGLEAVLDGRSSLAEATRTDTRSGLDCLLASRSARHPQALLQSDSFAELLRTARQRYQLVVIDSPPVMHVADALVLAPHSDAALFTVAWRSSSRRMVHEAIQRLPDAARARTATVLTQVRRGRLSPQDYYQGYSSQPPTPALRLMRQ